MVDLNIIEYNNIEDASMNTTAATTDWNVAGVWNVPWVTSPSVNATSSVFNLPAAPIPTPDLIWWSTNLVFTADDYNTVSRSVWTISLADWTTYTISSTGTTWNMTAVTYIYYNWTTSLQTTTTPQTAVWAGKIMVCVAKNSTSPSLAQFQAFWTLWNWVFITADNIAANTITANQIASNTITSTQISSSYIYAWTINADNITSWTITGRTLQTATSWQRVVIDQATNRIQFYESGWADCWYLQGQNTTYWDFMYFSTSIYAWWAILWNTLPTASNKTLWISSAERQDLYLSNNLYLNWYVLDDNGSWYLRWRWNNVLVTNGNSWGAAAAAWYIEVNINWTAVRLLYRA